MPLSKSALKLYVATLLIDTYKNRYVATHDNPCAYLQATFPEKKSKERVMLNLTGNFVDIMCEVNPEHKKHTIHENCKKVLCMDILIVIYSCIKSALRWYDLYSQMLQKDGFTINPNNRCVANKMINVK